MKYWILTDEEENSVLSDKDRVSAVTDGEHNDKSIGSSVYRISRYSVLHLLG